MKNTINIEPNFKNLSLKDNEIIKVSLMIGLVLGSKHYKYINHIKENVIMPLLHADLDNLDFSNYYTLEESLTKYLKNEKSK